MSDTTDTPPPLAARHGLAFGGPQICQRCGMPIIAGKAVEHCACRCVQPPCSPYRIRVTRLSVVPDNEPIFSERCTHVSIEDEAAGEFLEIQQMGGRNDTDSHTIRVDPDEWTALKQAVDTLLADMANDQVEARED